MQFQFLTVLFKTLVDNPYELGAVVSRAIHNEKYPATKLLVNF